MYCFDDIVPSEKGLVLRETSANLYSLVTYYFSRLFTEILGIVIPTILNAITIYFFAGLDFGASYFLVFSTHLLIQSRCSCFNHSSATLLGYFSVPSVVTQQVPLH